MSVFSISSNVFGEAKLRVLKANLVWQSSRLLGDANMRVDEEMIILKTNLRFSTRGTYFQVDITVDFRRKIYVRIQSGYALLVDG
mmetsp:Transcript_22888/g.34359  ORF Transcript_22888/g.34359 Transcript_22888/m.34359 type:complete len:85 (+) Transcript_22888:699-953(+)